MLGLTFVVGAKADPASVSLTMGKRLPKTVCAVALLGIGPARVGTGCWQVGSD